MEWYTQILFSSGYIRWEVQTFIIFVSVENHTCHSNFTPSLCAKVGLIYSMKTTHSIDPRIIIITITVILSMRYNGFSKFEDGGCEFIPCPDLTSQELHIKWSTGNSV